MKIRIALTIGCLLLILLLADCGITSLPSPTDTPLPAPSAEPTGPVAQRSTPPAERPTATPTDGEIVDWTVPPEGWRQHASERWAVSFYVPGDWQETEPDHLAGDDGFARLAPFDGPGASVDQACEWLANHRRDLYGPAPGVLSVPRENTVDVGYHPCLILGGAADEGDESEYEAAIVLANPAPASERAPSLLLLDVDPGHAPAIARSLAYLRQAPPAPTLSASSLNRELAPEEVPDELPLRVETFGDLTLEEYRIVEAGVDAPGHFEFFGRIPGSVLDTRRAWRHSPVAPHLEPVQVDGHVVAVEAVAYEGVALPGETVYSTYVSVQVDGQEVYRYNMALGHAAIFPLYYLGSWDGRWVVEANGMLIVDGAIVNQDWGYQEIFGCQELNGQPFYFFSQEGRTYLSYGGETLPVSYDSVYHGYCCEPAAFNAAGNGQMVWFYALRDGFWHYVELGAYDG